jgi:hypothetical protein
VQDLVQVQTQGLPTCIKVAGRRRDTYTVAGRRRDTVQVP